MRSRFCLAMILVGLLAGCAADSDKRTNSEKALGRWNTTRASVMCSLATDQYKAADFPKCRQTIDDALRLDPRHVPLRILSAKVAIEQGQLELAEKDLATAREVDPRNAEADYLSGIVNQRWQRLQTAYDFYTSAASKAPTEVAYTLARSEMLVALDRVEEAISLLNDKLSVFENSAAIRDAAGLLWMQRGHYLAAIDMFRQAGALAADDTVIREHLAMALYYAGQHKDAGELLDRLLKDPALARRPDLVLMRGECHAQMNQMREARQCFETVTQIQPSNADAWLRLAKVAYQCGDIKRTELAVRKALWVDVSNSDAHLLLGYLHLKENRLSDALSEFGKANALSRDDTVSLCMIGYVKQRLGRSDEAIQYYAKALKIKPKDELAARLMAGAGGDQ